MSKLCTLKALVPGSVVEVPKGYQVCEGEKAIVLGLEYASDEKRISASLLRRTGQEFSKLELPSQPDETEVAVADDVVLQKAAIGAFVARKIELPNLGMSAGCDPEIFVTHGDGSVFPAWEFMPSEDEARVSAKEWLTKKYPVTDFTGDVNPTDLRMADIAQNYCPQAVPSYWDGAQAEFAPWAKNCLETLHHGTREGLKAVLDFARRKDPLAKLTLQNVVELPEKTLKTADDKYIQFRCSESYNIYNDPGDGVPNARDYKYRCAGGHIHIGYTRAFTAPGIEQIVRSLDGVLGVIGVSLAAGIDNPERRHTYGRAGEFRLPKHGLEYRVLSNHWLSHPAIAMLVFELARANVRLGESGLYNLCWIASEQEIQEVINNCDVDGARAIIRRNAGVLVGMLNGMWPETCLRSLAKVVKMRALALKTILNGIASTIEVPGDIEGNWKLNNPEAWKQHCRGVGDSWQSLANL